ncbi:uncharacterized protein LOC142025071 isoform X2 [Carettochelys insculpta]|uniref:uncharacterized protein LOC142025071 isoform X2 n=1 Tax=Carettochelys insculpta TaxID=44489 RepID=UPI003EBB0A3F
MPWGCLQLREEKSYNTVADIADKYEIGELLSVKEFCELCLARERRTERLVICKRFRKRDGRKVRQAARNEILILKMVSHPNILQLIDTFETRKEFYIIQELWRTWSITPSKATPRSCSGTSTCRALRMEPSRSPAGHPSTWPRRSSLGNATAAQWTAGQQGSSSSSCCRGTPRSMPTQTRSLAGAMTGSSSDASWLGTTASIPPTGMRSPLPPSHWCRSYWRWIRTRGSQHRRPWGTSGLPAVQPRKRTSRRESVLRSGRTSPKPNGGRPFESPPSCSDFAPWSLAPIPLYHPQKCWWRGPAPQTPPPGSQQGPLKT